jgi:cholesterol oxidase
MNNDVIVIGSGFGGAIVACRLAEAGYKVLVLERGRRWDKKTTDKATGYPRKPDDPWVWDHEHPEKMNGWLDLRVFEHMAVAQGAAVGGGSLIYANISCEAPPHVFDEPTWPDEINFGELKPYYDKVAAMMNVQRIPDNQWTDRMKLMRDAAVKIGKGDRFKPLELAVTFDPDWNYGINDPHNPNKSRTFINEQGVEQGTCIHLGNCDIGCDVNARNTLDRNYIPKAEKHSAQVRPLHLVTDVSPMAGGYRVSYDELKDGTRIPGQETARLVVIAAGSLGSTELLLRCRDINRSLPGISRFLGRDWSSNGDFLTPAFYKDRVLDPTKGPTISSAIDFLDGSEKGQRFWIEDGGVPSLLGDYLLTKTKTPQKNVLAKALIDSIQQLLRNSDPFKNVMPWFAQGMDAANGQLEMKRPWWFFGSRRLDLKWDIAASLPMEDAIVKMHETLSEKTGGVPLVPPTWSLMKYLVTPHPLGGCSMGDTPAEGVVSHTGEVFGCRNLYVSDAAIIPEALGVNPSRTIGALAERIAKIIVSEGR